MPDHPVYHTFTLARIGQRRWEGATTVDIACEFGRPLGSLCAVFENIGMIEKRRSVTPRGRLKKHQRKRLTVFKGYDARRWGEERGEVTAL